MARRSGINESQEPTGALRVRCPFITNRSRDRARTTDLDWCVAEALSRRPHLTRRSTRRAANAETPAHPVTAQGPADADICAELDETRELGHDAGPLILSEEAEELLFAEQREVTLLTPKRVSTVERPRTSYSPQGEPRSPIVDAGPLHMHHRPRAASSRRHARLWVARRSERPRRSPHHSDKARVPDDRDPLIDTSGAGNPNRESERQRWSSRRTAELRIFPATSVAGSRADVTACVRDRSSSSGQSTPSAWLLWSPSRSAVDDPPVTHTIRSRARGRLLLRRREPEAEGVLPWCAVSSPVRLRPSSTSCSTERRSAPHDLGRS